MLLEINRSPFSSSDILIIIIICYSYSDLLIRHFSTLLLCTNCNLFRYPIQTPHNSAALPYTDVPMMTREPQEQPCKRCNNPH